MSEEKVQEESTAATISTPGRCRPFLKWAGGKTQILPELLLRMPKFSGRYFEPFLGGGALFFATQPKKAVLSDVNHELINAYVVIRDNPEQLIEDLAQHVYERDYFYSMRDADRHPEYSSWSRVKRASRLLYLNKTCFNGLYRVNTKGQFNTPFGRYANPKIVDRDNLLACSKALAGVELICADFDKIESELKPDDFIYLDPPYVPLSGTANFTSYSSGGFDITMQERLAEFCRHLNRRHIHFILSNSSAPWVVAQYAHFNIDYVSVPRAINSKGDKRNAVQEVIVTNFETGIPVRAT